MGQIRDRMEADLALRGAAKGTCAVYLRYAAAFVAFFMRPPTQLGTDHVRAWLLHMLRDMRRSPRTVNVARAALRFLFDVTLQQPDVMASIRSVRVLHRQPDVPSGSQVAALLAHARIPKHRSMLTLLYGTGMRVSEMLRLQPADIDSKPPRSHRPAAPKGAGSAARVLEGRPPEGTFALRRPIGRRHDGPQRGQPRGEQGGSARGDQAARLSPPAAPRVRDAPA
jgi:site-specific recombinase XerD